MSNIGISFAKIKIIFGIFRTQQALLFLSISQQVALILLNIPKGFIYPIIDPAIYPNRKKLIHTHKHKNKKSKNGQ